MMMMMITRMEVTVMVAAAVDEMTTVITVGTMESVDQTAVAMEIGVKEKEAAEAEAGRQVTEVTKGTL